MPDLLLTNAALKKVLGITGDAVGTTDTQTLSGKTLTVPVISTISNSGTITVPTGTDTLVGKATTDVLTNKTLTTPTINGTKWSDPATKTAAYTLTTTDSIIKANAVAGAFTLTLPAASGNTGLTYTIIRTDLGSSPNALTIDANASETIGGNLTYVLWPAESLTIECDGTGWQVITGPVYPQGTALRKGAAGRRFIAGLVTNTTLLTSTTGPTVNTLYAMPFYNPVVAKYDIIECEVTTLGSGSNIRLGIYRDAGIGYPGTLLFDSGDLSAATTGVKSATITSSVQVFQPGLYWFTYENSATVPQIRILPGASSMIPMLGLATPFGANLPGVGYTVAHTVGALPDPYTAGASVRAAVSAVASPIPAVGVRSI
jgi:hypothetical protein